MTTQQMSERDAVDVDAGGAAVVILEGESSWVSNAPWWLISVGFHLVLILLAGLIMIEKMVALEAGEVSITISNNAERKAFEIERTPDVINRRGIPKDEVGAPTEEPAIFFPFARVSDHNESKDNEDYHQMKGDSKDFLSYLPGSGGGIRGRQTGQGPGVYDTMGVGPGGGPGGRYGGRFGGQEDLVSKGGGRKDTVCTTLAGLRWLARHQNADGHWDGDAYMGECGKTSKGTCGGPAYPEYDTGLTGLGLLAFLGAGYTHLSRDVYDGICFGQVVKKAQLWLFANQDSDGCLGGRSAPKYMYNHTLAALALCEAYGMTSAPPIREPAQKSIDFLVSAQNPGAGWRYTARGGENDTSVTGWAVMALKSAEISGLNVPASGYAGARAWLDEVTAADNDVGYSSRDSVGQVVVPNKNDNYADHDALVAIAIMSRIFMDKKKDDPRLKGGVARLLKDLPAWEGPKIDFYYWYYASLALFQYDGPSGPMWKTWNDPMKNALVASQKTEKDGCLSGSWDPIDRWGFEGGRVYATAVNTMTLEVYYRYANVFGGDRAVVLK